MDDGFWWFAGAITIVIVLIAALRAAGAEADEPPDVPHSSLE